MRPPTEKQAVPRIAGLLADLFGRSPKVRHVGDTERYDYAISVGEHHFTAEYKSNASGGSVAAAVKSIERESANGPSAKLPLIIVPFMGQVGRQVCDESRISWIDLSGNAKIVARGVRIWIEGRPNQFLDRGRPPNIFAPKSSRVARQLLIAPGRFQTQAELARRSGLGDGYISKIVRRLEQEHYLDVNDEGGVRPRDPNLMVAAWRESYDFSHHGIIKGHVPARTGDEVLKRVVSELSHEKVEWAATGLAAAWLYTNYASFRLATFYLSSMPSRSLLEQLEFSEEPQGANLWLVLPDDEGVLQGSQVQRDVRCVSPVQAYLDLKGHPERARDAAAELRSAHLKWSDDAK